MGSTRVAALALASLLPILAASPSARAGTPASARTLGTATAHRLGTVGARRCPGARRVQLAAPSGPQSLSPATFVSRYSLGRCAKVPRTAGGTAAQSGTTSQPTDPGSGNPFTGSVGYVDPSSPARQAADQLRPTDPTDAALLDKIGSRPTADWFGDWNPTSTVASTVRGRVQSEQSAGALPVLVLYAIPQRDCGSYSSGGLQDAAAYAAWVDQVATGIGKAKAVVVLEPDALASLDCLSASDQSAREQMLAAAVSRLRKQSAVTLYLDAGNEGWQPASVMAARLTAAGVAQTRGFSLNVSNFYPTVGEQAYGDALSARLGGKHYVVDTSRNGNGSNGAWCNPDGRALGTPWTTMSGSSSADALLWIKYPGKSDGTCNGGPSAGTFWVDYALGLASRAAF